MFVYKNRYGVIHAVNDEQVAAKASYDGKYAEFAAKRGHRCSDGGDAYPIIDAMRLMMTTEGDIKVTTGKGGVKDLGLKLTSGHTLNRIKKFQAWCKQQLD